MMLHRHFEAEPDRNVTKLKDVAPGETEEFVSEVFPPHEEENREQPKRGRKKKEE